MSSKKNLSEEIKLGIEPVASPVMVDALKDLAEKEDELEEIAEPAEKIIDEINNPDEKIFEFKGLKEKLTLEEGLTFEDYSDLVHALYGAIRRVVRGVTKINGEYGYYPDITKSDIKRALDEIKDRIDEDDDLLDENLVSEDLDLAEDVVDERLSKDVIRALKNGNMLGGYNSQVDIENSTDRKITPEEAKRLIDSGQQDKVLTIINSNPVTYNAKGKPSSDHQVNVYGDDVYETRNGVSKWTTRKMPTDYVLNIANKDGSSRGARGNYEINLVNKDKDLLAQRELNPDSRNVNLSKVTAGTNINTWDLDHGRYEKSQARRYNDKADTYAKEAEQARKRLADLQKKHDEGHYYGSEENFQRDVNWLENDIAKYQGWADNYKKEAQKKNWEVKDKQAAMRNLDVRVALDKELHKNAKIKRDAEEAFQALGKVDVKIDDLKKNGAPQVQKWQREKKDLENRLNELMKQLRSLEIKGLDNDEINARELEFLMHRREAIENNSNEVLQKAKDFEAKVNAMHDRNSKWQAR